MYGYTLAQKKRLSNAGVADARVRRFHSVHHVGQGGLFKVPFQSALRGGKDPTQSLPDALPNRAGGVGLSWRAGKWFSNFDGSINLSQIDSTRRAVQSGTRPGPFAGVHQLCPLQDQQEPPDNDRVGVDAAGQKRRRDPIALFVGEDG